MRWLNVSLAGVVLSLAVSVASGATFFEDFDDYTPGTIPPDPPWGESRPYSGTAVVVDTTSVSSPNSVHLLDNLSFVGGSANLGHALDSPISGTYYLDYDVRIGDLGLHNASIWLYGDAGSDYLVHYSNGVHGGTAGWFYVYGVDGTGSGYDWFEAPLLEHNGDTETWYHVCRTLDMATNNGTFEIWQRDKPLNYASYSIGSPNPNTYIDTLRMETDGVLKADTYYDNIRFSTSPVPEPSTLLMWSIGALGLLVYAWRKRRCR